MRRISSRSWTRTFASSAESGSSRSSTFGSIASDRARATRCCMPPESWCGYRFAAWPRPTSSSSSATRALRSVLRLPADPEPVLDVLLRGHVREEAVRLEDHPHVALVGRRPRDVLAVDDDAARVGLVEAGDEAQRRRLAAAARPEQRHELAGLEREVDPLQRGHRPEGAPELLELDVRHLPADPDAHRALAAAPPDEEDREHRQPR